MAIAQLQTKNSSIMAAALVESCAILFGIFAMPLLTISFA